jgi:hypothetical protein
LGGGEVGDGEEEEEDEAADMLVRRLGVKRWASLLAAALRERKIMPAVL